MSDLSNASSLTYGTFLDRDTEVKPWLNLSLANTARDPALDLIINMVCTWVQNYVGRPVAPTTYHRRFDGGTGFMSAFIELPTWPILEVTSVTEYWGTSGPHVLGEATPTDQLDGFSVDYQTGRLNRVFPGLVIKPWFPGVRNVDVEWVAGFNPVPADIQVAALEMVAHWFRNTQQAQGGSGQLRTAANDYDPAGTSPGLWQGVPYRITALLDPYRVQGMG